MLKRMCTLFLAFAFATTASAANIGSDSVREAINDFNYSVKVEWNQKDEAFYRAQVDQLKAKIDAARAAGVTNAEIVSAASLNPEMAADLQQVLSVVSAQNLTAAQTSDLVMKSVQAHGQQGANWSGDGTLVVLGTIVLVGLIVAAALTAKPCKSNCGVGIYYDPFYYDYYDPFYYYYY